MNKFRIHINTRLGPVLSISLLHRDRLLTTVLLLILVIVGSVLIHSQATAGSGIPQETPKTYTLEIRYENPMAGQVSLVWGVNGWQTLPEQNRPAGTELHNGHMSTPMVPEGESFVVKLMLPAWTTVDYGFLTTQDDEGNPVSIWEADGDQDFQTVTTETDSVIDIQTARVPVDPDAVSEIAGGQPVHLDIKYISPSSGEVFLVWGVNGWMLAPEGERPVGTFVEGNVMHTPLVKEAGVYVTRVRVAPGSIVDFGFLTTKDGRGDAVEVWEANGEEDFHVTVNQDAVQEIQSQLTLNTGRDLPSIMIVGLYILIGLLVLAIVGFIFRRKPA